MWELDYKESWAPKNWCFWTAVLEKTLESLLDLKEIQPIHPKGDQSWVFIGRTDVEAETPILWPPAMKSWLIWKDPHLRRPWPWKDWRQEEKGTTEDEMVGWHPRLMDMSVSRLRELVVVREAWWAAVHRVARSQTGLSGWTELSWAESASVAGLSRSVMPDSATPRTAARRAPPSMGLSRHGDWSGLPFPSPGDLPDPGIEARSSSLQADSLPAELRGKPWALKKVVK